RRDGLYLREGADGTKIPFILDAQRDEEKRAKGIRVDNGEFIKDPGGKFLVFGESDLTALDTTSKLRVAIKTTLDLFGLANPNPNMRRDAVTKLGMDQNLEYLPFFEARLPKENNTMVRRELEKAVALTKLASTNPATVTEAATALGRMRSIGSLDFLEKIVADGKKNPGTANSNAVVAARTSIKEIEGYMAWGNFFGTAFRGLSLSAVLLVVALGLAITFGLMGVINMAHGEIMMIGAYTAFAVQNVFGKGLGLTILGKSMTIPGFGFTGTLLDNYFIAALPVSFLTGALVGLALERGVIRFLYKRPLESLLATWGVSLVLQQVVRATFGPANVQVNSPQWLSGSLVYNDILFAYNRLFVIAFAVLVVLLTYFILNKTSLGLQVRAVMQNRNMASCMGVRTNRVNMMTFAFGSGLAGMAGACLSQLGNVGPSLGQSYIVDCFMIVTLGGVGNLVGTISASAGIGVTDQILQPFLGAVMGKITVLAAIILFLQWRPAGLFVTKSRSLEG
ncbi:MAG: urea ABC transporter permease subunit UrtB, partial [Opitutaceae bacterium]|nr:urea ABC transporter permease subunit UrtB [Verrucomicrobiales bacterium]